jgi:hypothetical protein
MTKEQHLLRILKQAKSSLTLSEIMARMGADAPASQGAMRTVLLRTRKKLRGDVIVSDGRKYWLIEQQSLPLS